MRMSFARPLLRACLCAVVLQQAVWASALRLQLGTATAMRSGGRSGHSDVVCCGRRRWQPGMCTSAASDDEPAAEVQSYAERPLMFTDREAGKVGDKGAATLSPEADVMDAPLDLSGMPAWSQCPPWQAPAPSSGRVCWLRAACTSRGRGQPTGCSATAAGAERAASKVAYLTAAAGAERAAFGPPGMDQILKQLESIQKGTPKNIVVLGTRHCSLLHQQIIELLSYALVLSTPAGAQKSGCRPGTASKGSPPPPSHSPTNANLLHGSPDRPRARLRRPSTVPPTSTSSQQPRAPPPYRRLAAPLPPPYRPTTHPQATTTSTPRARRARTPPPSAVGCDQRPTSLTPTLTPLNH